MNNLSWIKLIYAFDFHINIPPWWLRLCALLIAGGLAGRSWYEKQTILPLVFVLLLAFLLFIRPLNAKFFLLVSLFVQTIVQTVRVFIMTTIYYTIFALYGWYFRRTRLSESAFSKSNKSSTFQRLDLSNMNWKKMF